MFIEHRTYTVKPGKLGEYLATYCRDGWPLHSAHAPCLGHYYTEAGELFRMISLWRYESFEDRLERRAALNADPLWQKAMAQISPLVTDIRSNLLVATPCWKDDDWYRALYAELDAMRMEGLLGWLTDDVELAFGSRPAVRGKAQVREAIGAFWASIQALEHRFINVIREADAMALEMSMRCTRKDGRVVSVPCATLLQRRSGKVCSMRTYADLAPVYAG